MHKGILFMALSIALTALSQDRLSGKSYATRSEVIAQNGMAATSQPLATQAALDILKKGGNAIDAAIAANAVLAVVEPMSNGIGGDLFAIVWDAKTRKLYGLNASGRCPKSLTIQAVREKGIEKIPTHGIVPVTVPGCVDGWFELHKKFGALSMKEILAPSIKYAEEGFPVTEVIAFVWQDIVSYIKDQPGFKETFTFDGRPPQKGEVFHNPKLAAALKIIGDQGRDAFYKGDIAKAIDAFIKANHGYLSYDDLAAHTSEWIDPVSANYRGYDVWELPPNGQGIAVLQMLNILEQYDIKRLGFGNSQYLHILIETIKLAFEDRAKYYADPAFNKIPVAKLISKEYAHKRKKLIDNKKAAKSYNPGELETGNTIYLTVADKHGNMVSLIQSTYWEFGSGVVVPEYGFALQNRGEQFSLNKDHCNALQPGKRPFHTIIPAFITKDGKPYISFGVMGGSMQPQGHVQVVVNMIDFGMNLQEAGDAPRIRCIGTSDPTGAKMNDGGIVNLEAGFPYATLHALIKMGHKARYFGGDYGGYQAIMRDEKHKVFYGASESRKDGQAGGY